MWFYNTTLVLLVRANDGSGVITVRTLGSLFEENKSHTHYIYCSFDESAIATFKLKDAIDLQRQKQLEILRMPRQAIECTDTNVTCKQVCAFICFSSTHKTPPFMIMHNITRVEIAMNHELWTSSLERGNEIRDVQKITHWKADTQRPKLLRRWGLPEIVFKRRGFFSRVRFRSWIWH